MTYFLLASFILALFHAEQVLQNSLQALHTCMEHLIPSLFLGMVCIRYLYENQFFQHFSFPKLEKLLGIDHEAMHYVYTCIFIGMPSGASIIQKAYQQNQLSLVASKRLLYTCCLIAPSFILFTCGISIFHSILKGILLYLSHFLGVFLLLLQTRNQPIHANTIIIPKKYPLNKVMMDSIYVIVCICGFVMLCSITSHLWCSFLPSSLANFVQIIMEFSNGISTLNKMPLSSFIKECGILSLLCFNGLCIHLQYFTFLDHIQLNYLTFLKYRFLHVLYAGLIYCILTMLASWLPLF